MILPLVFSRAAKSTGRAIKSTGKAAGKGIGSIAKHATSSNLRTIADLTGGSNVPIISKMLDGYEKLETLKRVADEKRQIAQEKQMEEMADRVQEANESRAKEDKSIADKISKMRLKNKKKLSKVKSKRASDIEVEDDLPQLERADDKPRSAFERVRNFEPKGRRNAVERNKRSHALAMGGKVSDTDKSMKSMSKDVKIIKDFVVDGDKDKLKQGGFSKSLMGMLLGKKLLGGASGAAAGAMGGGAGLMEGAALLAGSKGLSLIPKALRGVGKGIGAVGGAGLKAVSKVGALTGATSLIAKSGIAEKIAPTVAKAGGLVGKIGGKIGTLGRLGLGMAAGGAAIAPTALSTVPTTTSAASTVAQTAGKSSAAKFGASAAKGIGKSLIKKLPLIGLLAGVGFGVKRAMAGDFAGAGLEVASGLASTLPGLGTAGSIAIDTGLAARDMSREGDVNIPQSSAAQLESAAAGTNLKSDRLAEGDATEKFSQITEDLSSMLSLMLNERAGIYVRQATDPLKEKLLDMGMLSGETMSKDMQALNQVTKPTRNYGEQKYSGDSLQGLTAKETEALANNTALTESSGNISLRGSVSRG